MNRRADYTVRMMVDLAYMSDRQWVNVGEIAQRQDIPKSFMAKIASQAAAAGLLTTQRGIGGGLALTQPAHKITLLQILEAIDGPMALNQCTFEPSRCPRSNKCTVHPIWKKAQQQLNELLSNTLLSEIAMSSHLGEIAVDFTLKDIDGDTVSLRGLLSEKPVVMVFGSFT